LPTVVTDVLCIYCGCDCDDLEVTVDDDKIVDVSNACELGAQKFLGLDDPSRIKHPYIRVGGRLRRASLEKAIEKSAKILVEARRPLLYGWSLTSCEAHRVGIELTEEIGGIIDNTTSICHGPTILALQDVGISTCTLGEVKNRADVVYYWGSNPMQAHPRHLSRYTVYPHGFFQERGWRDRALIVVDVRKTDTAKIATHFLQVKPGKDYELFSALRLAIRGYKIPAKVGGIPRKQIEEVAKLSREAAFVAIFFGVGVTMSSAKHRNIDNVLCYTRDLHLHTKAIIMPMRGHGNVTGFNEVLTWETGYPYAVDFSRGYPRYNPGETSAVDVLLREEVDAALMIASDPAAHFPRKAVENLARVPVIAIESYRNLTTEIAEVVIPAAVAGVEAEGGIYRMDHVPLYMRKVMDPPAGILSDVEVLSKILTHVRKLKRSTQLKRRYR
jgi:formylmethanofuran dehydrogenase subunit B